MKYYLEAAINKIHGTPLGRRELQRLKGDLLCYRDAKDYIRSLGLEYGVRVKAVESLYRKTGGRNWLSPGQIDAIVEDARKHLDQNYDECTEFDLGGEG